MPVIKQGRQTIDTASGAEIERLADKLANVLDEEERHGDLSLVNGMLALLRVFSSSGRWIIDEGVKEKDDPTGEIRRRNKEMVKRMLDYAWHDCCGTRPETVEMDLADAEEYRRMLLTGKKAVTH